MAGSDDRGRERRRHDRTPVGLLVQYRLDAVSDFLAEYAADLSPGGMFIHTRARVAVGTRLQVRFSPRDGSRLVELRGRVVHALAGARPGIRAGASGAGRGDRRPHPPRLRRARALAPGHRLTPSLPATGGPGHGRSGPGGARVTAPSVILRSLRARLLAAFLAPALLLFAVAGAAGYVASRGILEDELGRSLSAVAAAAAGAAQRRAAADHRARGRRGSSTRTYRNLLRQLTEVRDAAGAQRVFAVDAHGPGAAWTRAATCRWARRCRSWRGTGWSWRASSTASSAASQVLFEGRDGRLYKTGYAPLRQGGKVVGAVGVEGSAAFFGPLRAPARAPSGPAGGGGAGAAGRAGACSRARGLARPLRRLMRGGAAHRPGRPVHARPAASPRRRSACSPRRWRRCAGRWRAGTGSSR